MSPEISNLPSSPPRRPDRASRHWTNALLLLGLSWLMMSLAFPPFNCWWLGLFCLTPFTLCVIHRPAKPRWMVLYYLLGVAFFTANLYWLIPVSIGGWIALCLFVALYFLLFAWGLQRVMIHLRWPAMLAVPVLFTATEYLRSTVLTGFPWFMLGNSQAPQLPLIQIADLFGVSGVTFFVALTSGWLADVLRLPLFKNSQTASQEPPAPGAPLKGRSPRRISPAIVRLTAIYLLVLIAVLLYGFYRLNQRTTTPGPRIAVVQENIPQSLKESGGIENDRSVFNRHMALSRQAAAQHPDLIAWPETMVPGYLNQRWLNLPRIFDPAVNAQIAMAQHNNAALANLSTTSGAYMLVGAELFDPHPSSVGVKSVRQNIAILYAPGQGQTRPYYAKRHLVPFGEYVPFMHSWPWLHQFLLRLTPIGFDYSDTPGDAWTHFVIHSRGHTYRFGTPICFEDAMPQPSRRFVAPVNGKKNADFLLSISNDGWFAAAELDQHLRMDQMRAVEERVPIARSVNTGDSGFVNSNGRIVKLVSVGGRHRGVAGYAISTLAIDSRISLYSRIGDALPIACGILSALAVAWTLVRPRRRTKLSGLSDEA